VVALSLLIICSFIVTWRNWVWGLLQNIFHLDSIPRSLEEMSVTWMQGKGPLSKRLVMFVFAGFAWALWTVRNKMAIE
jgi:hypothetical protein